jgi:glycosyltransferase involved in cell wall biosynthesis
VKVVSVLTSEARGGAEFAAVALLDALSARGHETVLLTNQPDLVEGRDVRARTLNLGPKLSTRTWRSHALRWPLHYRALRGELAAEAPYDVLLVHFKKEQLLAALLPARLRPRLAWAEWGPVPGPFGSGPARRVYSSAARRARVILAISEGTRSSLVAAGVPAELIHVVPNAVRADEIRFDPAGRARVRAELSVGPAEFLVGCISRFHPKKRNDVVIDAVAQLGDGTRLLLAGEGETESDLRTRARERGVPVDFLPTPREDVRAVLSAFDVAVFCPSPTEGAPRAVIIAMLAERPCISTGPEGVKALIEPGTGVIITPENDSAALKDALAAYRDDPERRLREGAHARRSAADRFDAPVVGALVERLLAG